MRVKTICFNTVYDSSRSLILWHQVRIYGIRLPKSTDETMAVQERLLQGEDIIFLALEIDFGLLCMQGV